MNEPVRNGLSVKAIVEDFRMYMDYFNLHFKTAFCTESPINDILREHEERCHRQLGAGDKEEANKTVTTIVGFSMLVGIALCALGIIFIEPLLMC